MHIHHRMLEKLRCSFTMAQGIIDNNMNVIHESKQSMR